MNIFMDRVDFNSTAGPHWFGRKLADCLTKNGHNIVPPFGDHKVDAHLAFVQASGRIPDVPLFQRLDGIWYNTEVDYNDMNTPIKATYDIADGVIFQSEWSKKPVETHFGKAENSKVIHNGVDFSIIQSVSPATGLEDYEKVWSCAAGWEGEPPNNAPRYIKRLEENIRYFQEHSGDRDILCVAGEVSYLPNPDPQKIIFLGELDIPNLYSLYRRSSYFLHLGRFDNCPNVVIDARAAGCQIICTSLGGTQEVAGKDAIIIEEDEWDFTPFAYNVPTTLDFTRNRVNTYDKDISIEYVSLQYLRFIGE